MQVLTEFIPRIRSLGDREAVRWVHGYRTEVSTYADIYGRIGACTNYLDEQGLKKGDRALIWAENRAEWTAFFWACIARGIQIVPIDFRFSAELASRIRADCSPKINVDSSVLDALSKRSPVHDFQTVPAEPDDIVEIIYTSGTTGEPKGVVHRHRNICANLTPFGAEIAKYRRWALPFQPVRILDLLPLSHMFGQSMGLYIPIFLEGAVAFTSEIHPDRVIQISHDNRISVIVAVPRILEMLQHEVERRNVLPSQPQLKGLPGIAAQWWRYRTVHARFGWKFWAFVAGGARMHPSVEEFWSQMGFLLVQGYGLTEASPVVAVNHPFSAAHGSLGRPVAGQEVRISEDGEILVRGESIAGTTDAEGWLHTGDLGKINDDGRLYYLGRKKDVIVTADGLNVSPDDVEAVLNSLPGIRDSAVVSIDDQVHAALILDDPAAGPESAAEFVRRANDQLEAHQRIHHWSIWPYPIFPRTESTLKTKRGEVAAQIRSGELNIARPATPDPSAMSSLERVELLTELEARHGIEIDEDAFTRARNAEELNQLIARPAQTAPKTSLSPWPLSWSARIIRAVFQRGLAIPLFRHYLPLSVEGTEHLAGVKPPVIFAANHTSNLDAPAVFSSLPPDWKRRLSPAVQAEYFRPHFAPSGFSFKDVVWSGFQYALARLLYNCYPLPQEMSGVRRALTYTSDLLRRGYCPLVFPEGKRTLDGGMQEFRPGIGMMAVRLQVPVIPVRISGLFDVYSVHHSWPVRGAVHVSIGAPLQFPSETTVEKAALAIETALKQLSSDGKGRLRIGN
jgi:long-chain acyl-CoA synthetase